MFKSVELTWYADCGTKRVDKVFLPDDDEKLINMNTGQPDALLTLDGVCATVGSISNGDVIVADSEGRLFRVIPERIINITIID